MFADDLIKQVVSVIVWCADVFQVWPVLSNCFQKYSGDSGIIERCCRCVRYAVRCLGKTSCDLLNPVLSQVNAFLAGKLIAGKSWSPHFSRYLVHCSCGLLVEQSSVFWIAKITAGFWNADNVINTRWCCLFGGICWIVWWFFFVVRLWHSIRIILIHAFSTSAAF